VVVNALDECSNKPSIFHSSFSSHRDEVLGLPEALIKAPFPNLRICVTSRPELDIDIKHVLDILTFRCVSLHEEGGQERDIGDYIKSVVDTHARSRKSKAEHKQLVIDVLTEKADNM
jgi:hypothetical protein